MGSEEIRNKDWLPVRLDLNSSSYQAISSGEKEEVYYFYNSDNGTKHDLPVNREQRRTSAIINQKQPVKKRERPRLITHEKQVQRKGFTLFQFPAVST